MSAWKDKEWGVQGEEGLCEMQCRVEVGLQAWEEINVSEDDLNKKPVNEKDHHQ